MADKKKLYDGSKFSMKTDKDNQESHRITDNTSVPHVEKAKSYTPSANYATRLQMLTEDAMSEGARASNIKNQASTKKKYNINPR